jgi:uncharacterized membrane protein YbaN (DUF454 family)
MRYLFIALGILATLLGTIGIVVPGLPTTPLILLASWCFYKSSDRLRKWLHASWLGKYIRNYESKGGLSVKGKVAAVVLMCIMVSISVSFLIKPIVVKVIVAVAGFIGSIVVIFFVPNAKG